MLALAAAASLAAAFCSPPALRAVQPRRSRDARLSATTTADLATLLSAHSLEIAALRSRASGKPIDEVALLRVAMEHPGDAPGALAALEKVLAWREGEGSAITAAAAAAVDEARRGGAWDNSPVFAAAPHAAAIGKYITPRNCLTLPLDSGDLCYIIRAGAIDDGALMAEVSEAQVVDFFLYAKEVNRVVADARSAATGRLVRVVTANDLSGVDLFGDATFRKALSASSKKADEIFPSLNGPTLLLNLPFLANALVKLFTPLFPPKVRAKLKFEKGPLAGVDDLTQLHNPQSSARSQFLAEIQAILA
ncbi:hypothetical protein AB1Y20_004020 [Prymnesium parvum]|uniref:CRAL-TRIO domain-containing protein n=1 Tax=Prymnesium parvum TaxID=97485 RepID=A0AB34J8N9_PRYPA